jgi:hypothetical protein
MSITRHFDRLTSLRDNLEDRLLLQETRHCFNNDDFDDGTVGELRARITEVSEEISTLSTWTYG